MTGFDLGSTEAGALLTAMCKSHVLKVRHAVPCYVLAPGRETVPVGSTGFQRLFCPLLGPTATLLAARLMEFPPGPVSVDDLGRSVGVSTQMESRRQTFSRALIRLNRFGVVAPDGGWLVVRTKVMEPDRVKHWGEFPTWLRDKEKSWLTNTAK